MAARDLHSRESYNTGIVRLPDGSRTTTCTSSVRSTSRLVYIDVDWHGRATS